MILDLMRLPVQAFTVARVSPMVCRARVTPGTVHIELNVPDERTVHVRVHVHLFQHPQVLDVDHQDHAR